MSDQLRRLVFQYSGVETFDQLRAMIADIIESEREFSTISGSAQLAGLTYDEWTADRILRKIGVK